MAGYDRFTADGKKFFKELEELAKMEVKVGFTEEKSGFNARHDAVSANDSESGATMAEIAAFNELGTSGMPSRPFLRNAYDNNAQNIEAMCAEQVKQLVNGKTTAEKALKAIGALQVGLIQSEIRDGTFEPNKESTIKRKKSDNTLIDTGTMRQSVHYVVKKKERS